MRKTERKQSILGMRGHRAKFWKCYVVPFNEDAVIYVFKEEELPNAFNRFMQWLLLGFVWEEVE